MKKIFYLLISVSLMPFSDASGCTTCGCGAGNYQYGILPQYQKNFVGIRYRYRSFDSRLDASHSAAYSYETFQSAEFWARYYPNDRLQFFAFIPYNFNNRQEGEITTNLHGLGDIVLSANYTVINTYDSTSSDLKHYLLVGGGVKLPTGKFNAIQDGLTINQNFQLGTGSVDFLLNLMYTLRYRNAGLNTEFTYSYNTTNTDEYRFGNRTRSGVNAFYIANTKAVTFMPNAGISLETFKDNEQFGEPFPDSGGWAMFYNAGVETYFKRFALGVSYTHPGKQKLFNEQVKANDRISMHLTFMF